MRAAVHRTIGEMIIQGILTILNDKNHSNEDDTTKDNNNNNNNVLLIFSSKCLDTSLRSGCSDTSLAVRLQAIWALGNLILVSVYIYIYIYMCVCVCVCV